MVIPVRLNNRQKTLSPEEAPSLRPNGRRMRTGVSLRMKESSSRRQTTMGPKMIYLLGSLVGFFEIIKAIGAPTAIFGLPLTIRSTKSINPKNGLMSLPQLPGWYTTVTYRRRGDKFRISLKR
jgi:hypothetical protein